MITADRDIIILNKWLDRTTRRDAYIPVQISGVAVYDYRTSTNEGGSIVGNARFAIRIPIDAAIENNRVYVPEAHYDVLDDASAYQSWTIHNEDKIIVCKYGIGDVDVPIYGSYPIDPADAEILATTIGYDKMLIHIMEYADNTMRGSDLVKHWRIGGV